MGQGVARVNDIVSGTCRASAPNHPRQFTGVWISGSDVCQADNLGIVRVGDVGVTDCNHHFTAVAGSDISTADNLAIHRVGDPVTVQEGGEGTTITGSDTVTTE
jgi:uncharacterized Zn-binding protein involved in type VI secretion